MENMNKMNHLLDKLAKLVYEIETEWNELSDYEFDQVMSTDYPFHKSFDEMANDINTWRHAVKVKSEETPVLKLGGKMVTIDISGDEAVLVEEDNE